MNNEKYISGIYNYCDRWCERCNFAHRCRIYQPTKANSSQQVEVNQNEFWKSIHDHFETAFDSIKKEVEKSGQDWESFYEEAMQLDIQEPELNQAEKRLIALAKIYYQKVQVWLNDNQAIFQEKEAELNQQQNLGIDIQQPALDLIDAVEVIQWYLFFIYTKLQRACKSEHDDWIQKEYPIQNDANGSAKVAWTATQRTIVAWEVIRSNFPERSDELLDIFVLLHQIIQEIPHVFPNVHRFIRPGFDENMANFKKLPYLKITN